MTKYNVSDIRNIALCGHGHAGKTSLADKLLQKTGAISRPASVDDGTSVCDFEEEEKHHKYSIEASLVHFDYGGKHFNLLDTPGYPDFIGQTLCALAGVDTACIMVNAHSGIEVNTRRVFQEAGKAGLGRFIIISKLDTDNIDFPTLVANIRKEFGKACQLMNVPLGLGPEIRGVVNTLRPGPDVKGAPVNVEEAGREFLETIIEVDEEVTANYFEGIQPDEATVDRLAIEAVAQGKLIPILCVAAKKDIGLVEVLEAWKHFALPPDRLPRVAKSPDGAEIPIQPDPSGPVIAQVYRTRIDPFVQKLSYVRIYSGTLKKDDLLHASAARKHLKVLQVLEVQGGETHPIESAGPGELVALAKMEELHTGTCLGDFVLPTVKFPTPMAGLAASPKSRGDEAKLSTAMHKIVEEDPTFHIDRDAQTKEMVMTGMSELHLQIIRERLKRRDKVEIETKEPKIPYRETIQQTAEGSYRHKKQSGGRGQFGEVHIRMYPLPRGTDIDAFCSKARFPSLREKHYDAKHNFLWVDSIVGGSIPNNFLPAIEKGFKERLDRGVIAGYQIQDVCVEVFFGKHHPVDSSEAAFKTAGSMAFRNVFQTAKPSLLEPIVKLHVTVPSSKLGDISSDLSGRRGRVLGMDSAGSDMQTIQAEAPLAEVSTYGRSLSSITGGTGSFSMEFSHYDLVPGNVLKEIVDKAQLHEEEEE